MEKIKEPKIGQYVLASHFSDHHPLDPWFIGHIKTIESIFGRDRYIIEEDSTNRRYRYVFSLTEEEATLWLEEHKDESIRIKDRELDDLICSCGGTFKSTGICFPVYPPLYEYRCNKCKYTIKKRGR